AEHGTDLPAPGAGSVDDVLGGDVALRGSDQPFARRLEVDRPHRIVADDLGAAGPRAYSHGVGGQGRVDVAVLGLVDGANDAVDAAKRIDPAKLFRRQQVEIVTDEAPETLDVAELVHPLGRAGDAQRAAAMEAGRHAGLRGRGARGGAPTK